MRLIPIVICLMLCSCIDHSDHYDGGNENKGGEGYAAQFSNHTEISVDIDSKYEGMVYSVYYSFPYEEGSLVKEPYLVGKTPIHTTLNVPKDVKTLYILGNGKMIESTVKNISINDDAGKSRASEGDIPNVTDEVIRTINNKYFPERTNNVKGEDLYKCTDLKVAETPSSGPFEKVQVWITYLSDGGFENPLAGSKLYGKLWFYTYPSDQLENLTVGDCTFYGRDDEGKIVEVPYKQIRVQDNNTNKNGQYIFNSWEENRKAEKGEYTRVLLGEFSKGVNIGFVFRGSNERPQFTTPALNLSQKKDALNFYGDIEYIGQTLTYQNNAGTFKLEKQVSNGFIQHIQVNDFEGNVLGMENRTPIYRAYDGDYNDMLCLIQSDPVALGPVDPIDPPVVETYAVEKGYYLFEDNYPEHGDFDFNDVVVEYAITSYADNSTKEVTARLLATGCLFTNEFGFKVNGSYVPIFQDIKGYYNVRDTSDETNSLTKTKTFSGEIKPYLYNGKGYIEEGVYNTKEFPYVLKIPISDSTTENPFRWCLETKSISDAYPFNLPRDDDWFRKPTNENLLIKREER